MTDPHDFTIKRIVSNLPAANPAATASFYQGLLGMRTLMDMHWISTFGGGADNALQISVADSGGSGTALPAVSIEVDNLDALLARLRAAGIEPEYGPVAEPWGVRRIYVRDPANNLINILEHV